MPMELLGIAINAAVVMSGGAWFIWWLLGRFDRLEARLDAMIQRMDDRDDAFQRRLHLSD